MNQRMLRIGSLSRSWIVAGLFACLAVSPAAQAKEPIPRPGGFWKCKTQSAVKGEFDGEDPVGLAARAHIPTDCALHWSDGRGKTYCFASNPSFLEFDSNPDILPRARAFWSAEHKER